MERITIYTIVEDSHEKYPFYARISTRQARAMGRMPTELGFFASPDEASQEAKIAYGNDSVYVSPEAFEAAIASV